MLLVESSSLASRKAFLGRRKEEEGEWTADLVSELATDNGELLLALASRKAFLRLS